MPFYFDEAAVRSYWEYCGEVQDVDMMTFPDTGRFRGIAIITFATHDGVSAALGYDGEQCEGKSTLVVRKYTKGGGGQEKRGNAEMQKTPGYNVAYVGNMPFDTEEKAIRGLFQVRFSPRGSGMEGKGYRHAR